MTGDPTNKTTGGGAFLQTNNSSFIHYTQNYDPAYGAILQTSTNNVTNLEAGGVAAFMPGLQGKYPYLMPAAALASASSSLLTGQLHAYAASEHADLGKVVTPPGAPPPQQFLTDYYSIASADAQFSTDFTTTNSTGHDVFVPISWQVDGGRGPGVIPYELRSLFGLTVYFNNYKSSTVGAINYVVDPDTGLLSTNSDGSSESFSDNFTVVDLGGDSRLMTGLFDIQPGQGIGSLAAALQISCADGTICDYSHTSSLSIGALPAGVSFSFDAPGFLTGGAGGGVAEPATWAMMLMGFASLGAALRHRRPAIGVSLAA